MTNEQRPVTIVTGGSRGIGAATVLELARLGHRVLVNYRTDVQAAERVVALVAEAGGRAFAAQADVTDDTEVEHLFTTAEEHFGPVTGLVNNAGLTAHIGDLADTPVDVVRRVIDVNLTGAVLCARRAAQVMSTRRGGVGGVIVNVSSAAATLGSPHEYVHYAATKAGIDALTMGLAKELAGEGIRVNGVAPGIVRTEIHAAAGQPDRADRIVDRIPLRRSGEPAEVAAAIGWLVGPEATYVTGATIRVSGGL